MIVLCLDALLDLRALALCRTPWSGWALVSRLILGLAYLIIFMVYLGGGGSVFPGDFSYWGMSPGYGAPLIFLLLWLLGVWNLVHAAVHRHAFASALGACLGLIRRPDASALAPAPAMTMGVDRRRNNNDDDAGSSGGGFMAAIRGLGIRKSAAPRGGGGGGGGASDDDDEDVEAARRPRRPASSRAETVAPIVAQSSEVDLVTLNGRGSQSQDNKIMDSTSTLGNVPPPAANRT